MEVIRRRGRERSAFAAFVHDIEPRLRQALVATYGPVDGSEATADALSWAWEHWGRLADVDNKTAYLYRVGQSATRRFQSRPFPPAMIAEAVTDHPDLAPELLPALERLSAQQRTIVLLVHAYGWRQSEVAAVMDLNPSTVREHLNRALTRLRSDLEVHDAH
jgi:DNA-directed RNA polymerase specialized sigma24 family protein